MLSRRQCLQAVLAAAAISPALLSLAGCASVSQALGGTCPEDPAESGGIDWTPDILHPVLWGFQDLGVPPSSLGRSLPNDSPLDGAPAPGPLRIFYPASAQSTNAPPILKLCLVRYPVVLFLHGDPPCPDTNYYVRWNTLGMVLARSGYVVVVPLLGLGHGLSLPLDGSPDISYALSVLDWVRIGWEHRRWVDTDATATAVAGHSYGALLAARVLRARQTISAYVGLSGAWTELNDVEALLNAVRPPSFFMWERPSPFAEMDSNQTWGMVPFGKTFAAFGAPSGNGGTAGQHFDYLSPWPGCDFPRGTCSLIERVAAELVALFISRNVPVKLSHAPIPPNLNPPTVALTQKQMAFGSGHLNGIRAISTQKGCSIDLTWNTPSDTGSRHLGP